MIELKREGERWIKALTSWILKAFSIFVPSGHRADLGTAARPRRGPQFSLDDILPLPDFFPTSENSSYFPTLPTACCLLPTTLLGAFPKTRTFVIPRQVLVLRRQAFVRAGRGLVRIERSLVRITWGFCPLPATFRPLNDPK